MVLVISFIATLIYFQQDMNFNFPVLKNYLAKTLSQNSDGHKIEIGSTKVFFGPNLSKLMIRVSDLSIKKDNTDSVMVENIDINLNILQSITSNNFHYSLKLSSIPIEFKRTVKNSILISLGNYKLNTRETYGTFFSSWIKNISSIEVLNPQVTITDEMIGVAVELTTKRLNFIASNNSFFITAQANFPQDNFNDALVDFKASYSGNNTSIRTETTVKNLIPSQLRIVNNTDYSIFKNIDFAVAGSLNVELDENKKIKSYYGNLTANDIAFFQLEKSDNKQKLSSLLVLFESTADPYVIDLKSVNLSSKYFNMLGFGELRLKNQDKLANIKISFPDSYLFLSENKNDRLQIDNSKLEIDLYNDAVILKNASFFVDSTSVEIEGDFSFLVAPNKFNKFSAHATNVDINLLKKLNSASYFHASPHIHFIKNLEKFNISIDWTIDHLSKLDFAYLLTFSESTFLTGIEGKQFIMRDGKIALTSESLLFEVEESYVEEIDGFKLYFNNINLESIKDRNKFNILISSEFEILSILKNTDFVSIFKKMGFNLSHDIKYRDYLLHNNLTGQLKVRLNNLDSLSIIENPNLIFDFQKIKGSLLFENFILNLPMFDEPLVVSSIDANVSKHDLIFKINGELAGIPLEGIYEKVFLRDVAATLQVNGQAELNNFTPEFLTKVGYLGNGKIKFQNNITFPPGQRPVVRFSADLLHASVGVSNFGFKKLKGEPAILALGWTPGKPTSFHFNTATHDFKGLLFSSKHKVNKIIATTVKLGDYFQGKASYDFSNNQNVIVVDGLFYDYLKAPKYNFWSAENNFKLKTNILNFKIKDNLVLTSFSGFVGFSPTLSGYGSARLNGGPEVNIKFERNGEERIFEVKSNNAGEFLLESQIYSSGFGGDLNLKFVRMPDTNIKGSIIVRNLRVIEAPLLAKLISLTSIEGIIDILSSKGLVFNRIQADFSTNRKFLTISDGLAVNQSFGITLSGTREMDRKIIDYNGVLSPAYSVNGMVKKIPLVGDILGGKEGEGAFGINYSAVGKIDEPKVSINPLSIIAPGKLRYFFN
ncbi:MAG: hypothetical protein CML40_01710 [Rhodobacteraceae bacterium]|nr:MAG: hypothetical protein CML40_01710 [Paracoccaceae bacterium]